MWSHKRVTVQNTYKLPKNRFDIWRARKNKDVSRCFFKTKNVGRTKAYLGLKKLKYLLWSLLSFVFAENCFASSTQTRGHSKMVYAFWNLDKRRIFIGKQVLTLKLWWRIIQTTWYVKTVNETILIIFSHSKKIVVFLKSSMTVKELNFVSASSMSVIASSQHNNIQTNTISDTQPINMQQLHTTNTNSTHRTAHELIRLKMHQLTEWTT